MAEMSNTRRFNIGGVDYAKKEFTVNDGLGMGIEAGGTIYVHLPQGVRAVKVTSVVTENGMSAIKFENLTSP